MNRRLLLGSREHRDDDQIITVEIVRRVALLDGFYLVRDAQGKIYRVHVSQFLKGNVK